MKPMNRIAILLTCAAVAAAVAQWQDLGPAPTGIDTGRVSAIACSPTNPNLYFVGGADGGVWRTTDGGTNWTAVTSNAPTSTTGALAIDPQNENIIYVGTGEANYANHCRGGLGILKSTDGGNTWTQLAESTFGGRTFAKLVIHPQNTQTLYAAVARAGGFPNPELRAAKGHPLRNGPVGIFKSTDGGVNWTQLTNGLPNQAATDVDINRTNPDILYAAIGHPFGASENGIYKTTDGGATWTKLAGGLPTGTVGRISLAIAPSQPDRVYTLITNACDNFGNNGSTLGGWRTDNGGTSWTSISVGGIQSSYGWFLSTVSVRPTDANTVIMGGLSLVRSTNAGSSFSTITPPHVDMHATTWDANGRLLSGHDGGVARSENIGSGWTALNIGLGTIQFYAGLSTHPTDPDILLGGTQDNGTNRRTSNTKQWNGVIGGDGGWTQIDPRNGIRQFGESQGTGNLYRSEGGGFGYSGSGISGSDRNCFLPAYLIDPLDSQRMLYGTHRVYRSTNGGSSWSAISGDLTTGSWYAIRSLAQSASDPNYVYAATNDNRILRSTDGGVNFTVVHTNAPGWPRVTREIFVTPNNPLDVYLAVAQYGQAQVQHTTDGGQTWTPMDQNLPDIPVNTVAVDVRGKFPVIYAGAENGLWYTINGGANWYRYRADLPYAPVIDIRLEIQRRRMVIATQGRGAWRVPIAIPGDMNDDGNIDFADINAFVLGLSDPEEYRRQYPNLDPNISGDMNGDGNLDFGDINGFVEILAA